MSRKQRGSTSRRKAMKSLATLHRRIADMRLDWMHKTARQLAERFDVLCIEVLSLEGMKPLRGRKVSDIAWHKFVSALQWHCQKAVSILGKVGRYYPSSKLYSECGFVNEGLTLKERECGYALTAGRCTTVRRTLRSILTGKGFGSLLLKCETGHRLREEAA